MVLEVFIHIGRLEDFRKGRPVNAKIGFASQYDVKVLIDFRKYNVFIPQGQNGLIVLRKKTLVDYLHLRKFFKYKSN